MESNIFCGGIDEFGLLGDGRWKWRVMQRCSRESEGGSETLPGEEGAAADMGDGDGQMPGLGGARAAQRGVRASFGVSALLRPQLSLYVEVLGPCPLLSPSLSPSCPLSSHFQVSFSFF
ncbi:hypothetical protein CK203_089357 [Vitis vinifera]|uniref:Uncharacterized protein n=1 Tax=Vitis vinifera TaxID=29760 RepID=A0A438D2Z7_VITVI|nr:hypothetical protein CK203_089357 [Vitis vinifera]